VNSYGGEYLLANFGSIGLFLIVGVLFALTTILLPVALSLLGIVPRNPSPTKSSTYECGMQTIGDSWVRFNFRYYFYALFFVLFDILTIFLYPWAVSFGGLEREFKVFGLIVVVIFLLILGVGFVYAWKKRVLEWK